MLELPWLQSHLARIPPYRKANQEIPGFEPRGGFHVTEEKVTGAPMMVSRHVLPSTIVVVLSRSSADMRVKKTKQALVSTHIDKNTFTYPNAFIIIVVVASCHFLVVVPPRHVAVIVILLT